MATATKIRGVTLRPYELARLLRDGSVCVVRAMKWQPYPAKASGLLGPIGADDMAWPRGHGCVSITNRPDGPSDILDDCPFGRVGDVAAVREAWGYTRCVYVDQQAIYYAVDGVGMGICHTAGNESDVWLGDALDVYEPDRIRHAAKMPLWAVRHFMVLASVRAGQVQGVTEGEAVEAGCDGKCPVGNVPAYQAGPHSYHLAQLHDAHTRNPAHKWERNPWCWVGVFQLRGDE